MTDINEFSIIGSENSTNTKMRLSNPQLYMQKNGNTHTIKTNDI